MPGNPRELIMVAEVALAHPHQDRGCSWRSRPAAHPNDRLARGELRSGGVGHDALGNSRGS